MNFGPHYVLPEFVKLDFPKSGGILLTIGANVFEMDGDTAEKLGLKLIKASVECEGSDE